MLLKSLSLAGFKSFADRTRLEFRAGVNVVVGPNGSGKSNLLDAMAWVMGTQATTALRTEKMEDVIFAGTATRPALGRAAVTLTFDNRDRFLPVELDEISMSRRLYRDGTSEYELNGTACRLRDLHEILSDGGVGRHQHVLVGQGQIGEILSSRPDEHRSVIEEAAGVTKHRGRRDRSVRRLEQTGVDVERLTDILEEQKRRLRPLKRQANAAERYDAVRAAAQALHLWLGGQALRSFSAREESATVEKAALDAALHRDESALSDLSDGLDDLRAEAGMVRRDLERDTVAAARLETLSERLERIAAVAGERHNAIKGSITGAGQRLKDLEAERAHILDEIEGQANAEQRLQIEVEEHEGRYLAHEDEERALTEQLGLTAEGLVANLRGDLRALEAAGDRDQRELAALETRRVGISQKLSSGVDDRASLVQSIEQTDAEAGPSEAAYHDATSSRAAAQARWEQSEARRQTAELTLAAARARAEALESAFAGRGDPAARVKAAGFDAVLGPLAERLDVPPDMAAAVDAALGDWREAFVAARIDDVASLAASMKSDGFGGVAFLASGADDGEAIATSVAADWGVDALVDLLGPNADVATAKSLIGDVVVVEGWSTAWTLVQRYPHLRAVTPEGDLVSPHGMVLAEPDGAGPAALQAVAVDLELAESDSVRAESALPAARGAFEASREREREALEALEALEARLAGHTEALALIDRVHAEYKAELDRINERIGLVVRESELRDERVRELHARLDELKGEDERRQRAWEELGRRRRVVTSSKAVARSDREGTAAELTRSLERRTMLERRLTAAGAERESLQQEPLDPELLVRLAATQARGHRAVRACRAHIALLRLRQQSLRGLVASAEADLAAELDRKADLELEIRTARERLASVAIELTEVSIRAEAASEALRRDADATDAEALSAPEPVLDEGADPHVTLSSLDTQLRRMGPVNPLAAAEHDELAAEVAMLESQLEDLRDARHELKKVIAALDEKMAALFLEAFEEIATLYEENFALVFPGGKGRLRLTDPSNVLETGVDIDAQPLGKKIGRLSLLSGGERSLVALAFLFAVFRARPSPFYVLDEVEAALDDSNLARFLRLVDRLRRTAQLVVITHQQHTMEAADILYGVTMEPGESSIVVARRLTDAVV